MRGISKILVLLLLALSQILVSANGLAEANTNELALGKSSKVSEKISIELNQPVEFDFKTRSDILNMRSHEVSKYPQLLKRPYVPYNPVFGAIEDGKPWWGLAGAAVFDSGTRSMLGLSEESRFVMNPFMLVAANPGSTKIWNAGLFSEKQINDPNFPYFWIPESLTIDPAKHLGVVTYNLSAYQKKILATGMLKGQVQINRFSLVAYNARDFGFNYIFFNQDKSVHVVNDNHADSPSYIKQFIHCGGTCGCPTTCCNNMSPFMGEIDRLRITRLPARAVVYLWKDQPEDLRKSPDMVFLLEFR